MSGWNQDGAEQGSEEFIPFEDDVITEEQFKQLTERQNLPDGQYKMKITKVERVAPTAEKVGGDRVTFVVEYTTIKPVPEGGWKPQSRLFKKFLNPNEGQVKSEGFDKQDKARLVKACGQEVSGQVNMYLALKACEGCSVWVQSVNRSGADGQTYNDLKGFKPVTG